MIGRESETLKPVKWLKIENSETDEEDSALGISSGASSSSELGQHDYENTKKTVSSSSNSITTSNMVKIEVLKAARPVKMDLSSQASSDRYVVNSIKRYTRFRQREKKKTLVEKNLGGPRITRASAGAIKFLEVCFAYCSSADAYTYTYSCSIQTKTDKTDRVFHHAIIRCILNF